jgi:hypothetical protein
VSNQPYQDHEAKVIALKNKINQRWQYEKGKEKNQITVKMWNALKGDQGMIGSYLNLWKKKGTMRAVFISEAKTQVEEAFKILLEYEKKKDTTNENKILDFISNL